MTRQKVVKSHSKS